MSLDECLCELLGSESGGVDTTNLLELKDNDKDDRKNSSFAGHFCFPIDSVDLAAVVRNCNSSPTAALMWRPRFGERAAQAAGDADYLFEPLRWPAFRIASVVLRCRTRARAS